MKSRRATIIGAGLAGLSLAVSLARRGFDVKVYEQGILTMSAATRSAGILVTIAEEPLLGMALDSLSFYKRIDPGLAWRVRVLWIAPERSCVERVVRAHRKRGLESRVLDEPPDWVEARPGETYAVVEEYIVDSGRVLPALLSEAERLGVEVVEERVEGSPGSYRAGGERLEGLVVVAAGPWTPRLVPGLSALVYRCQAATIEGARPGLPIEDDSLDYYIVPVSPARSNIGDGPNRLVSDPLDGFTADPEDTYSVVERYAQRVPEAWESRVLQVWSAPCIVGRDGRPIVAWAGRETLVFTGLDGAGLTLAPALAMRIARSLEAGRRELPSLPRPAEPPETRGIPEPYDLC